jgi:hypothetical protein
MSEKVDNYELEDQERPGLVFEKFDKKVKKQFLKEQNPEVKPKDVFVGYKEKGKKNKTKRSKST